MPKTKEKEYLDGWKRAKADFENYKKEEGNRTERMLEFQRAGMLIDILKIYDNFERAKKTLPKDSEWAKGILLCISQISEFLKENGIEEINKEDFDPNFHEAIEEVEGEKGKVIEVLEKGYLLNGQVLRPAKVKVAK